MSINPLLILWLGTLGCVFGSSSTYRRPFALVGQNHCTWGPAYWCSHVAKAKECGAIKHCANVWSRLQFPEKAENCFICESFIIGAKKLNENNIAMKNIGNYMDTMCSYFKGVEIQEKCQLDVVEYLPEVFKLLKFGMNEKSICHTLNFCLKGRLDRLDSLDSVETTTSITNVTTVSPDAKICEDCKVFFTDVRQRLTSSVVINNIEKAFDQELCPYLGPFTKVCEQYVKMYVPILMQQLSMYIAPEFLCSILTFCPLSKEAAVSHMMESIVKNNNLKDECQNCKIFLDNIKKEMASNTTAEELRKLLKEEVCSHLGQYKEMCEIVVDSYANVVLADLVEKINSSVVCKDIGVCSSQILINAIAEHFSKIKFSTVNPFREATECEMCKVLIKELRSVVEDKHVQEQITDFISNEVCSRLGDMKSACLQLVMEYKPLIIKSIESLLDPVAGCAAVGMCTKENSTAVKPPTMPMATLLPVLFEPFKRVGLVLPEKLKTDEECTLCKMVIGEMEKFLNDENIQKEIEMLLDKVCNLLPSAYSTSCEKFIDTYTAGIISILVQELKPTVVCKSLNICPGNANFGESDQIGCNYCDKIVNEAAENMHFHPDITENEFKNYFYEICQMGDQVTSICELVIKHSQNVYEALKKGDTPRSVCTFLKMCPSTALKFPPQTEHFFVVMCEILKATGINTECKDLATISKEIHAESTSKELNVQNLNNGPLCTACTLVIEEIEKKITTNSTEEEIRKLVDKMCNKISPSLEHECDELMQYEDKLIRILMKSYSPNEICQIIKLCQDNQLKLA